MKNSESEFLAPVNLVDMPSGRSLSVISISPEIPEYLSKLQSYGIIPGVNLEKKGHRGDRIEIVMKGKSIKIPHDLAETIWVKWS